MSGNGATSAAGAGADAGGAAASAGAGGSATTTSQFAIIVGGVKVPLSSAAGTSLAGVQASVKQAVAKDLGKVSPGTEVAGSVDLTHLKDLCDLTADAKLMASLWSAAQSRFHFPQRRPMPDSVRLFWAENKLYEKTVSLPPRAARGAMPFALVEVVYAT